MFPLSSSSASPRPEQMMHRPSVWTFLPIFTGTKNDDSYGDLPIKGGKVGDGAGTFVENPDPRLLCSLSASHYLLLSAFLLLVHGSSFDLSLVVTVANKLSLSETTVLPVSPEDMPKVEEMFEQLGEASAGVWAKPNARRKTKIVCTIGPSTNTREMIWKLAKLE
ncbi:hypothetical protein HPP92_007467 [Vanilla planifolia]|uniref:Pyruvate kinase n=1 Tax=Vanilla planifolia TaxID=51239 RepID=A0A835RKC1_VANPL|nr:hypothetical protein HPP92_007467 [Vanilla planifolia]